MTTLKVVAEADTGPAKAERLRSCEEVIRTHVAAFVEVGRALREIKDARLYKADGHGDFSSYLASASNRFGLKRPYCYQLIAHF